MTYQDNLTRPEMRTARAPGLAPTNGTDDMHPLRTLGPKYAPHNASAPIFEGIDIAGIVAAAVITLGPLAASAFGMGG